ncbi:MAG: hypothetical protein LBH26_06840, partial [Treponema sp.]|nr:hypothetical protein [Treponema sp.]
MRFKRFILSFLLLLLPLAAGAAPVIWEGTSSNDWSNPANWSTNSVPVSTDDVEIPAVSYPSPVLSSPSADCKSVTIDSGGSLDIGNFTLNVGIGGVT